MAIFQDLVVPLIMACWVASYPEAGRRGYKATAISAINIDFDLLFGLPSSAGKRLYYRTAYSVLPSLGLVKDCIQAWLIPFDYAVNDIIASLAADKYVLQGTRLFSGEVAIQTGPTTSEDMILKG